jgi:hypothetical protein
MARAQAVGEDAIGIPAAEPDAAPARAFGMGGAFLARADDATAASWNPAGLSYLRAPELSFVGVYNSFTTTQNLDNDSLKGSSVDFAAFTWPVGAGEIRGAVQLSYQRAISFDGTRHVDTVAALRQRRKPDRYAAAARGRWRATAASTWSRWARACASAVTSARASP